MYNGAPLATGPRHHITNSSDVYTLNVTDVLLSDTGNYSCRAENIAGFRLSTVVITVLGMINFQNSHRLWYYYINEYMIITVQ